MKTISLGSRKELDDWIYVLLFALKEVFQESLGFSPFEFVLETLWEVPFDKKLQSSNSFRLSKEIVFIIFC
jgi:hypothetical protein